MKRFASILLSSLVMMPVCMASRAFTVTLDGVEVQDGSTVEAGYTATRSELAAMLTWAPNLEIKSVAGKTYVTVEIATDATGFKICWPRVCQEIEAGVPKVVESTVGESPEKMEIECFRIVMAGNEVEPSSATVTARDDDGGELRFTISCIDVDLAGLESVSADGAREETARFTVDGKRLDAPERGVNIVRYSDGSVAKVAVK